MGFGSPERPQGTTLVVVLAFAAPAHAVDQQLPETIVTTAPRVEVAAPCIRLFSRHLGSPQHPARSAAAGTPQAGAPLTHRAPFTLDRSPIRSERTASPPPSVPERTAAGNPGSTSITGSGGGSGAVAALFVAALQLVLLRLPPRLLLERPG
jgi:hypothetical protein